MALSLNDLKAHATVSGTTDDAVLTRILGAARKHVERLLGYALDDEEALPDGAPADLEHAVYMIAADWYENREASITGTIITTLPIGVAEIIAEHRRYTFGLCDGE